MASDTSESNIEQPPDSLDASWIFGFVLARECDELGYCGGYLILNGFGHPCEFHCSLPVKPTRTQQILYGPQLPSFLTGHLIVPELLAKTKLTPSTILTDNFQAVSTETSLKYPICVLNHQEHNSFTQDACLDSQTSDFDSAEPSAEIAEHPTLPGHLIDWSYRQLDKRIRFASSNDLQTRKLELFAEQFSLHEPFGRIRDALSEAQSAAAA